MLITTNISHQVSKNSADSLIMALFSTLSTLSTLRTHTSSVFLFLMLFLISLLSPDTQAQNTNLPAYSNQEHLGLVSCSGSTCHGATKPSTQSTVKQNEFFIWKRHDQHAKSYDHLKNDLSRRIAKNLGLKAAHEAKVCLDCHADNVPENRRGKRFQISDGVTCEACHGGAGSKLGVKDAAKDATAPQTKGWLTDHTTGKQGKEGHQQNLANGMYPTENPLERTKLCFSCHFGDEHKFVSHKILGAGHPRLKFELDTYTSTQPAHYVVDKDYQQRKPSVVDGTQVWAIGQAVAAGLFLDQLTINNNLSAAGLFPELSLFDCQSCHHEMKNRRWTGHTGLKPGVVRLNDSSFVLLRHAVAILHPDWGRKLKQGLLSLHQATTKNKQATVKAAASLRAIVGGLAQEFANHRFTKAEKRTLLKAIIKEGVSGRHADYIVAEQSLMALDSISRSVPLKIKLAPLYALFGDEFSNKSEDHPKYNIKAYRNRLKAIKIR